MNLILFQELSWRTSPKRRLAPWRWGVPWIMELRTFCTLNGYIGVEQEDYGKSDMEVGFQSDNFERCADGFACCS